MPSTPIIITPELAGQTLAAVLRHQLPNHSWSQVRRIIEVRRVCINGELWLDPARRVKEGDLVEVFSSSAPKPRVYEALILRHLDQDLVVVEKPSGVATMRHPAEREWTAERKALTPTLEELLPPQIAEREGRSKKDPRVRLRFVHRLDKETSGLLVVARSVEAERGLGQQFKAHTVVRRYLAVVPGRAEAQTITSRLIRDRGDGRRGSTDEEEEGKEAITHVEVRERLRGYTVVSCRLETGRTHQIRIHLAELGHAVCGEKVYNRRPNEAPKPDESGAPRLALHAAELGFDHPITGEAVHWSMELPEDLRLFLERLRHPPSPPRQRPHPRPQHPGDAASRDPDQVD
jgi:23S rRNA pseudouridine1911/1915/1917 synthase